ncbi:MAG: hypothetical protein LBL30_02325 [Holosporales bacterium]|jgi:hypothetical protein|nr:hypothetical protein [Holosporales bacterium]
MFDKTVNWASLAMCLVIVTKLNATLRYSAEDSYHGSSVMQQRTFIPDIAERTAAPKQQIADLSNFSNILKPQSSSKLQYDGGISRQSSRRQYSSIKDTNYYSPIEIPDHLPNIIKNDLSDEISSIDQPIPDEFLPIRRYTSSSEIIISTAKKEESNTASDDDQLLDEQEGKKSKKRKAGQKSSKKEDREIKKVEITITKTKWPAKAIGKPEHVTKTSIPMQ